MSLEPAEETIPTSVRLVDITHVAKEPSALKTRWTPDSGGPNDRVVSWIPTVLQTPKTV